jgi:hypothetical protein
MNPYWRHLWPQFIFLFGSIWALVGTPFVCVAVYQFFAGHGKEALIFAGFGLAFAGTGWFLVVKAIRKTIKAIALLRSGTIACGKVLKKVVDYSATINGRHPLYLEYTFVSSDGRRFTSQSQYVPRRQEDLWKEDGEILVAFDPRDPASHEADVYGLISSLRS